MAEIFTVYFSLNGERTNARFEFQAHAEHLADVLHDDDHAENIVVADMQRNTVYEPGDEEPEAAA